MTEVILPAPRTTFLGTTAITVNSPLSLGETIRSMNIAFAGASWLTSSLALFVPFRVEYPLIAAKLFWSNASGISGNVDVGIYDEAGNRLVSSGSTAQAGASVAQIVNTTDLPLTPGQRYYLALAMDNTTGSFFRAAPAAGICQAIGILQQASAFPLPNPATFAKCTTAYIPQFGLATRSGF